MYWETGSWPGGYTPPWETPPPVVLPDDPAEAIKFLMDNNWRISFAPNLRKEGSKVGADYDSYASSTTITEALAVRGVTKNVLAKELVLNLLRAQDPAHDEQANVGDNDALADDASEAVFPEWEVARLKLLPKKGGFSDCKNWGGICLLDIASKILSQIIVDRMQLVQKEFGLEMQNGFKSGCGTVDGLFSTVLGLQKREEHGLATWVLSIDLMKAFDTVPRELHFQILRKFGMPDHFVNLFIPLHTRCKIKFKIGDVDTGVDSKIGVRQGSCEGPVLFLFTIQACLETLDWPVPKPTFCTRDGARGRLKGDAIRFGREAMTIFELWASLFADVCATLFESKADMIAGAHSLYNHFLRFGLHIHIGRGGAASTTEAMYCLARARL
jgi:hypothetical protein